MTSTIVFPRTSITEENSIGTNMSVVSRHATALEVCDIVYGNSESATSLDAVERFYEANAIYENPFITATSRSVISDIYSLARQLCYVDVPKPLAMLYILLRLKPPEKPRTGAGVNSWFQGLRVWTEIGDICESESFDGHRKSIVEHTVNILFLPGLHSDRMRPTHHASLSTSSLITDPGSTHLSLGNHHSTPHPTNPQLPIPGTGFGVPSPLHLQLHILTRLSFNEQGRITHHRDIWDVKDVLGLVPGASLAQWIAAHLAARSLTFVANLFTWGAKSTRPNAKGRKLDNRAADLEQGSDNMREMTPAAQYGAYAKHVLDLEKISAPR